MTQLQMEFDLKSEPTTQQVCMMCHFSSECKGCCKRCTSKCNSSQICQKGVPGQSERLDTWLDIITTTPNLQELRKFLKQ
jgi:hypothetical protein